MEFEDHLISTQTLIISTNIIINCKALYETTNWNEIKRPQNGKYRMVVQEEDKHLPNGSLVFLQEGTSYKGVIFKKPSKKYFLNSVTMIMKVENKYINIKVSNKGKLQITGCSKDEYAFIILNGFWSLIRENKELWSFQNKEDKYLEAIIIPVMCNINFSVDFQINREALDSIIKTETEFRSILEPSDGYVGVNIKICTEEEPLNKVMIDRYIFMNDTFVKSEINYMSYISTLPQKEQKKKLSKCLVNTFLVFYSGKVIMSGGISKINRKKAYDIFMELICKHKKLILLTE